MGMRKWKTYLVSMFYVVLVPPTDMVTSNFTLAESHENFLLPQKKKSMQKKSTAWWCIGLVQTAFECVQKNPHPRLDFMSGSAEVLNFGLFQSSSQSLVWTLVLDWTSAFKSLLQSLVHVFASPVSHCFCKFNSSSVGFAGSSATGHLEPFQYILPVLNLWELPISFFSMAPNR